MKKNDALEGLRGLACLSVIACHFFFVAFPHLGRIRDASFMKYWPPRWPWEEWFSQPPFTILYNGDFAVILFFVLSGYVLINKFYRDGDRRLLVAGAIKRYPRLMIPAGVSIALALLLMRTGAMHAQLMPSDAIAGWARETYTQAPSIKAAVHAALFGVPFIGDGTALAWNGPLWTMQVELWGALALFAAFLIAGRRPLVAALLFLVYVNLGSLTLVYTVPFMAGALLNWATPFLRAHGRLSTALFLVGLAISCITMVPDFDPARQALGSVFGVFGHRVDTLRAWYVLAAFCMVGGVLGGGPVAATLGRPVLAFFGKISFSAYILHWPIIFSLGIWAIDQYMKAGMEYLDAAWAAFATTLAVIILAATAVERYVDRPAIAFANWLAATLMRKRSVPPAAPMPEAQGGA